ncbi:MAG: hypothetical protein QG551_404 [Patescibacteria group bacterium]|nr:hypothetical protein [Patescibacteria group bacterium]
MISDIVKPRIEKIKIFSQKYRIYVMPLALLIGFLLDFLTLNRVDQLFDNLVLVTHLIIIGITITLLFSKDRKLGKIFRVFKYAPIIEYVMLFSFGAVFSGSVIFYSKSASLWSAWPFLLILLILMLGTEFKKNYFQTVLFQINFYFIALMSYVVILVPVVLKKMGGDIFLLSGVVALILISLFLVFLSTIDMSSVRKYIKSLILSISSIFVLFNVLYFTNIIPPIPLSLKFASVYHNVYRITSNEYVGTYEPNPWWNVLRERSRSVNKGSAESVFVFSSVFAPTKLDTKIYHEWQHFNSTKGVWESTDKVYLSVVGGRAEGFRGYSKKSNVPDGKWRVLIKTERNQRLGQIYFKVQNVNREVNLVEEVL